MTAPTLRLPGEHAAPVAFSFDGAELSGHAGEPLAAALLAAGIRTVGRSAVDGAPRGLFCAMGVCQECVVLVDGVRREACLTPLRAGMAVRSG